MPLRIHLLGQPSIHQDGNLVDLPGNRPLGLLAYLLVTGKPHHREHLVDLFFNKPSDPRAALRWTLSKIRKAIGGVYIVSNRQEISFNFQVDYWLDISAFEAGELELFRGDFLEGLYLRDALRFEEWLLFERQRLRGKYQSGLEKQLEKHLQQGDNAAIVITANKLLQMDNLREDWQRSLIEAYARLGKRKIALAQFEQCRQVLKTELAMEPEAETVDLAEAIQSGKIGPSYSAIETDMASSSAILAQDMRAPEQAGRRKTPYFQGLPRQGLTTLGAISLSVVLILVLGRFLVVRSQSPEGKQPHPSTTVNASQSDPQQFVNTEVTILGPLVDDSARLFVQSMIPFEERSGIHIVYIPGEDPYEKSISTSLETGDPPDIVVFPQPSLLAEYARQGKIINIRSFLGDDYLKQQYPDSLLALATVDSQMLGVWHTLDLKSLVWYPKQAFEAKGYEVPETWDELLALSDQIVADGGTPWCIGDEDGKFTGWVGTDWVEEILLRTAPPETYDAWVKHELPFDSPEVRRVFEIMGQIWLNDDYVYGGTANITTESFIDNPDHLFEDPPGCYLHKQASFAPLLFPQGVNYDQDYDFFYLPPIDPEFGKPVLGSGSIFAMVDDRPEVREVMRFLTTADSAQAMIKNGGYLTPHRDTPIEWFPTTADLRFAQIVLNADAYRFDGSDMMPKEVGLGSFYRGITEWVEGADLDTVLQEIDNSWPE